MVSAVPVAVFGLLPGPSVSLALSERPHAISTRALVFFRPAAVPQLSFSLTWVSSPVSDETSLYSPLTGLVDGRGAVGQGGVARIVRRLVMSPRIAATLGPRVGSASAVASTYRSVPEPSLRDLARLFLSLSGLWDQWDTVASSVSSADAVSCAGLLPGSGVPGQASVPSACSSACVPTSSVGSPAGGPTAAGPSSLSERSQESPHSERRHRRSSSGEKYHSGEKRRRARSPFPSHSSCMACSSNSTSSAGEQGCVMPPPPASRSGTGGGLSGRDCSGSGHDRSPCPDPSGLGLGSRSLPVPDLSCLGYGGRAPPPPPPPLSGVGDEDHSSAVDSLNSERDDSFWSVLRPIQEFHSLEEQAIVAPNQCKTSLAPVYGLQSIVPGSSLAHFHSAAVSL